MEMLTRRRVVLCSVFLFATTFEVVSAYLIYPHATVFQITAGLGTPVELPQHRLYVGIGYQFNYDLPNKPNSFYTVQIFPTRPAGKRDLSAVEAHQREYNESIEYTKQAWDWHTKYRNHSHNERLHHPSDLTAGELYRDFEGTLTRLGFHETCLLRSVCELARHPFADDEQNLITETLTFLLTPSLHEAFSSNDVAYREVYEEAERRGFMGEDCSRVYPECKKDILSGISKILNT